MNSRVEWGYLRVGRGLIGLGLSAAVVLMGALGALADEYGEWGDGKKTAGGYEEYEYASSPAQVSYDGDVYTYTTGADGQAYYQVYDGEWSESYTFDDQPVTYKWDPAVVGHGGKQYLFYTGEDGKYYHNPYDGAEWAGWEDISGDYTFAEAPYANKYGEDLIFAYGVASDGYLYYSTWTEDGWSEWAPVSEEYKAAWYQPYALDWDGYNNVFWTGEDGYVYWNRYDGDTEEWTGAKQLPYEAEEYQYASSPYAIGYSVDDTLYAYAVTKDGQPNWNTFDGEGWSGWKAYPSEYGYEATYSPYAYEYQDTQYIYTTAKDGHAYYTTYDGETWSEWYDLGANYKYDISSYEYEDAYYLTYTGENGYLYYKEYAAEDDGY